MNTALPKPSRVGLIGAGGISRAHIQGWLDMGAEVYIYSLEGAPELSATFGGTVVDSLAELWPHVDLVDIVTPTTSHAEICLEAIAQGKDVICEKPLARTSEAAADVVAAAKAAGVSLYPAHVVRYFPEYAAAKKAVVDGAIGKVAISRFRRVSSAPKAEWFYDEAISGGIVMDQMIHDLDQALWIAGPVTSVYARSTTRTSDLGRTASATVTLQHTNGAISYCYGVWGNPSLPFSYSFDISGDSGKLTYDKSADETSRIQLHDEGSGETDYIPSGNGVESPYASELRGFAAAIAGGPQASVSATDGVLAIKVAEAALQSIATGKPQPMDQGAL